MDGHFVPNLTFGPKMIEGIRPRTELPLDAHLMISDPATYVDEFLDAGCDSITFHVEVDPEQIAPTLEAIRAAGRAAGLAVKPETPLSALEPYRDLLDIVLVMTVEPGFGGQSFMRDVADGEAARGARVPLATTRSAARSTSTAASTARPRSSSAGSASTSSSSAPCSGSRAATWAARSASSGRSPTRATSTGSTTASRRSRATRWSRSPSCPKHLAWRFMAEIERGGIPVIPLRGNGRFNPDGLRDFDLLVPASAETLTEERHAADRERYLEEAERWRVAYAAEHGVKPPELPRPGTGAGEVIPPEVDPARPARA